MRMLKTHYVENIVITVSPTDEGEVVEKDEDDILYLHDSSSDALRIEDDDLMEIISGRSSRSDYVTMTSFKPGINDQDS